MPLTDHEKEKIRDAEILKNEVRQELQPQPRQSALSKLFQQQSVLLVLGFLLTTLAGSWLTYFWKQRDWKNQQSYLTQQRALDKKYTVIEKTFKEVALTTSAAEDVLGTFYGEKWTRKEIEERRDNWNKTSRDWRVASKILSQDLAVNFTNPEVQATFQEIVEKRKFLGNAIGNLLRGERNPGSEKDLKDEVQQANGLANEINSLLYKCGASMTKEILPAPIQ